jgi:two-component system alkaline phosphatase synthesis response regulator PhoP
MPKILLADDDRMIISLLKFLLEMDGFQVIVSAGRGSELIESFHREMPDIIMMDIFLGAESGIDLVRKLRQTPDLEGMKVLLTSGMDLREECLAAGANDFLLKPYMPEELFQKLRHMSG